LHCNVPSYPGNEDGQKYIKMSFDKSQMATLVVMFPSGRAVAVIEETKMTSSGGARSGGNNLKTNADQVGIQ
jgi:hypothetical protein